MKKDTATDRVAQGPSLKAASKDGPLELEIAKLTEALLRERADSMNVSRRAAEERTKLAGFYKSMVVRELLPAIDSFEKALTLNPEDKGLQAIQKQLSTALSKIGVERIATVGAKFDPAYHEAVTMDDSGEGTEEVVVEELQSGYKLLDEIIRHAMVKVSMQ
jgi:molecular chaperone GrpE